MKFESGKSVISLHVNGEMKEAVVRPADTLLYALREQIGCYDVKAGCENGDCGACTVLMDGMPQYACLTLGVEAIGHEVMTVEGLSGDAPIQQAFIQHGAIQCGYCTPGFLLNCHALIQNVPDADDATIAEWLESNLCRCTGYEEIGQAVRAVLGTQTGQSGQVGKANQAQANPPA